MSYTISEKSYLLSEVASSNCKWPLPCIVDAGFFGETSWDTVSSGQTILLSALEKRRRVLARSSDQNYYSIPHDYPLRFSVVLSNQTETTPKLMSEILLKHQLPVTIKFLKSDSTLHSKRGRKVLLPADQIVFVGSYNEKYIVGNCILNGVLQKEILLLPTFLKIRVRSIDGVEGSSKTEWKTIQKTWKEESRKNTTNPIRPPLDIVLFENLPPDIESSDQKQNCSEIYETLEPSAYIALNFNSEKSESNEYEALSEITSQPDYEDVLKSDKTDKTPGPRQNTNFSGRIKFHSELQDALVTHKLSSDSSAKTTLRAGHDIPTRKEITAPRPPSQHSKSSGQGKPPPNIRPPPKPPIEIVAYETIDYKELSSSAFQDEVSRDYEIEPRTNSRIRSLKDVPTSVKSLNCDEIADCLRLLNMSKYSEQFIANQIDGSLLEELEESILTDELQMTPMHAKKLIMFAQKGWRPI